MTSSTAQALPVDSGCARSSIVVAIIAVVVRRYRLVQARSAKWTSISTSMDEYFRYGSIGTEQAQGVPYWIWLVLPRLFSEYLLAPRWIRMLLGLYNEPAKKSRWVFGQADRIRPGGDQLRGLPLQHDQIVRSRIAGAVSGRRNQHLRWAGAISASCSPADSDPRFTAGQYSRRDRQDRYKLFFHRPHSLPLRADSRDQESVHPAKAAVCLDREPAVLGAGRIDPFNPVKRNILNVDVGDTTGNSDMVPIWNLGARPKNSALPLRRS